MTREADELASRTVATISGLHTLSQDEDDDGRAVVQASAILLAAVAAARSIGARAAARRFGRQDFTPTPVEPEKHSQMDAGLATCWEAPQALPTMVRSEVVRAAADEFVLESIEIVNEPDFEIDDMEEDPEDLPEPYEDEETYEEFSERVAREYEEQDTPEEEDDFEEWLKEQDRLNDLWEAEQDRLNDLWEAEQDRLNDLWEAEQDRIYDEEERLEAEEEAKRYELPPVKELEKEWAFILDNDPDPCGRCKLAKGRRIKYPQHFKGIHPQCGCEPVLCLVPIRLADKPRERK